MNKRMFADFYKIGLEWSQRDLRFELLNADCEEVAGELSPHEYAFYFARQAMIDIRDRRHKDWGKLAWIAWKWSQFTWWLSRLGKKKTTKTRSPIKTWLDAIGGKE